MFFFFFQAEDGIRDIGVTGVQTCALPIFAVEAGVVSGRDWEDALDALPWEEGEVLVVGSSRLGPVARVFLGSSSTKIVRSSPVPVVVIPRGADVHLEDTGSSSWVESSG